MKEHIDEFINLLGLFQVGQMFGLRNFGCFDGRIAKCIFLDDLIDVRLLSAAKNVNTVVDVYKRQEVNLTGGEMGILIGKRGQTLDSLQYLVSLVVNKKTCLLYTSILDLMLEAMYLITSLSIL